MQDLLQAADATLLKWTSSQSAQFSKDTSVLKKLVVKWAQLSDVLEGDFQNVLSCRERLRARAHVPPS